MLIPDNIVDFESPGEKILYLKLKNDISIQKMYVLHSLFTNYHFKNISGELDFLVLAPNQGIFAIEVKHGGISRKGGTWNFTNRNGEITKKSKSPFAQVDGTMNSIRSFVLEKIKYDRNKYNRLSKILWGTGVAFTSMREAIDFGTEGHSWQILMKQGLSLPFSNYISTLSNGWHSQNKEKYWYDTVQSRPTNEDCDLILQILRGDFDIDYSDINRINDNESLIDAYTKEQFSLLDFFNYNDRCLVEGAAGTGKTLMALEVAQRKMKDNLRVGIFCYNNRLGIKLKKSIDLISDTCNDNSYAGTFHSYLLKQTDSNTPISEIERQQYFDEELPLEFLDQNDSLKESEKFDILIIDEAQDLITPYYMEVFDMILKGGIKEGKWILFGDFSNQAIYLNKPEEILFLLAEKATFVKFPPLKINCRNSRNIAKKNTLMTGVSMPEFRSGSLLGNVVVTRFPSKGGQQEVVEELIFEILKRNIPLIRITILSPKQFERSIANNSKQINSWIEQGLQFSTIHSYKGLENTIVILYDFDEISSINAQKLLYTGISRAKQELYIVLAKTHEQAFNKLVESNYLKLG